jgi:WD40 repeat protein
MAMSRDGSTLAVGGRDGRVTIWDIQTSRQLADLRQHDGEVLGLAFHPAGTALASWSASGPMPLWGVSRPIGRLTPGDTR